MTQKYTYKIETTKTVIPEDIYPRGWHVPYDHELTGEFRVPVIGDRFLHSTLSTVVILAKSSYDKDEPRLIVRKKPVRVVTFRSVGEPRLPRLDEWYSNGELFYKAGADHCLGENLRQIYTRTETQE